MEKNKVIVLTGACGGLGQAFINTLLSPPNEQNTALLLCGTNMDKLEKLKKDMLSIYPNAKLYLYKLDLSNIENINALQNYLEQNNLTVSQLINNAGFITEGSIANYSQDELIHTIKVNCEGTIALTKLILDLNENKNLNIITISSLAANYPMPYMSIYSATKAMLKSFMLSLRYEYRKQNVKVTVVLPSAIATSQAMKDAINAQGFKGKISCVSPIKIARASLKANKKNKPILIPGFFNKFVNFVSNLCPTRIKIAFIGKSWKKSQIKRKIK